MVRFRSVSNYARTTYVHAPFVGWVSEVLLQSEYILHNMQQTFSILIPSYINDSKKKLPSYVSGGTTPLSNEPLILTLPCILIWWKESVNLLILLSNISVCCQHLISCLHDFNSIIMLEVNYILYISLLIYYLLRN